MIYGNALAIPHQPRRLGLQLQIQTGSKARKASFEFLLKTNESLRSYVYEVEDFGIL